MHEEDGVGSMPGRVLSRSTYQLHQSKEALRLAKEKEEGPLLKVETRVTGSSQASAQPDYLKLLTKYTNPQPHNSLLQ